MSGIQFDKIISSDLGRAFITAYIIAQRLGYASEIERYMELRDVNYGDLANLPYTGANSAYPILTPQENADYTPPHGESLALMQQRVMSGMEAISRLNPDKTILLVAHDGTINAVRASFTGQDIGIVDADSANGHDFVATFVYDEGKVTAFTELTSELFGDNARDGPDGPQASGVKSRRPGI